MRSFLKRFMFFVLSWVAMPFAAAAQDLGTPDGPVILTVTGVPGHDEPLVFDLAMLEALDRTAFETTTIWTEGVQQFEGVSLLALVQALGVESGVLRATAINDYTVEVPLADAVPDGPIIAYHANGAPMSVRDKGPLWLVYPYDANADYRSSVIHARSIWQLDRIEVVD